MTVGPTFGSGAPGAATELTTQEWFDAFDQLADMGCYLLTLTGGELFVRKDVVPEAERQKVRAQLERYCGQDTEGMIWIVEVLRSHQALVS